jgi:hypothetical protein
MAHEFLSDDWFAAIEALGAPPVGNAPDPGPINVVVTRGGGEDVQLSLVGGAMSRGLAEGAPTTITTPYDVAKALFIQRDQQAAMQAFMSGQIKVQGDMTKLMAMGQGAAPTAEQEAYAKSVLDLTQT